MTTFPHPPVATLPPAPRSAGELGSRLALALSLWFLMLMPVAIMAATAPKFAGFFREFGVKLSVTQSALVTLGRMAGSPLGVVFLLTVLPLLCLTLASIALPARSPGDARARRPRVVVLLVSVFAAAVVVAGVYWAGLAITMMSITEKLATTKPAPATAAQPAAAARPAEAPSR